GRGERFPSPKPPCGPLYGPRSGRRHPGMVMQYVVIAVVVVGLALVLWQAFAPGPRRRRAFSRAERLLEGGSWQQALALVEAQDSPGLSEAWRGRLRAAAGECHLRAADAALKEKRYEDALRHLQTATPLLALDEG